MLPFIIYLYLIINDICLFVKFDRGRLIPSLPSVSGRDSCPLKYFLKIAVVLNG